MRAVDTTRADRILNLCVYVCARGNELCSHMQAGMQNVCYPYGNGKYLKDYVVRKQHAKKNFELSQQLPQEALITQNQERTASRPHVMEVACRSWVKQMRVALTLELLLAMQSVSSGGRSWGAAFTTHRFYDTKRRPRPHKLWDSCRALIVESRGEVDGLSFSF